MYEYFLKNASIHVKPRPRLPSIPCRTLRSIQCSSAKWDNRSGNAMRHAGISDGRRFVAHDGCVQLPVESNPGKGRNPQNPFYTARRVCIARTMPSQDVCPSHAGIVSKRLYISSKFFLPSGKSFSIPNGMAIFQRGPPPNSGVECKGVWKNHDFRPISRSISQIMQDRAIGMEGQ